MNQACLLSRRLKSLHDDFPEPLGHRDGAHVNNESIDLAIFVEVHLIDRLKLLALELAPQSQGSTNCSPHQPSRCTQSQERFWPPDS